MPVPIKEDGFAGPNAPARVGQEVVQDPCPNHEYRPRAKRMGEIASFCRLCLNQQEMSKRWKDIRKAFMTIRSSTPKRCGPAKPRVISAARNKWEISIMTSLCPATALECVRLSIGVDCGQVSND